MDKTTYYVCLPHPITLQKEQGHSLAYQANIPMLPGCQANGHLLKETLQKIMTVKKTWVYSALQNHQLIPVPDNQIPVIHYLGDFNESERIECQKTMLEIQQHIDSLQY